MKCMRVCEISIFGLKLIRYRFPNTELKAEWIYYSNETKTGNSNQIKFIVFGINDGINSPLRQIHRVYICRVDAWIGVYKYDFKSNFYNGKYSYACLRLMTVHCAICVQLINSFALPLTVKTIFSKIVIINDEVIDLIHKVVRGYRG